MPGRLAYDHPLPHRSTDESQVLRADFLGCNGPGGGRRGRWIGSVSSCLVGRGGDQRLGRYLGRQRVTGLASVLVGA